jgi:hypothetical protein
MIKRLSFIACLFFIVFASSAQFDTSFAKINIQRCADSLTHGFKTKNWELFTRYSYPAMVGSLGGKKVFSNYLAAVFINIPDTAWKKYEAGKILQVIKQGNDLLAVVELISEIEWEGVKVTATDYLIGESWNGGLFWSFFDSQGDRISALRIKPDLSEQLFIPNRKEIKEPVSGQVKQ